MLFCYLFTHEMECQDLLCPVTTALGKLSWKGLQFEERLCYTRLYWIQSEILPKQTHTQITVSIDSEFPYITDSSATWNLLQFSEIHSFIVRCTTKASYFVIMLWLFNVFCWTSSCVENIFFCISYFQWLYFSLFLSISVEHNFLTHLHLCR